MFDIGVIPDAVLKIVIAVLIGGIIGAEREYRDKAAGFRTMIFICTGATMFTIFSKEIGGADDPVRIAANIVSGVGFLGAGTIMRGEGRVMGLTTAATIWLTAALGMGIGGGYYEETFAATGIILAVLVLFPIIEGWIDDIRDTRVYEIAGPGDSQFLEELRSIFRQSGLKSSEKVMKADGKIVSYWYARGAPKKHHQLTEKLVQNPQVTDMRY